MKKDEEESKEMWKRKREHEEQWEGTREQRVSFFLFFYLVSFLLLIVQMIKIEGCARMTFIFSLGVNVLIIPLVTNGSYHLGDLYISFSSCPLSPECGMRFLQS